MNTKVITLSRRVGLIDLFKEKGFKVGVEVGTDRGDYAKNICERFPEVKLYTLDPWLAYTEGNIVKTQEDMEAYREEAIKKLAPFNCEVMRQTSMEAVKDFRENSIDFVFIDGSHEYEFVYEDIVEWMKIVKSGGIVCGHDFVKDDPKKYGVIEAVNRYVEENNIDPLFVLRKGTFVDCWMFYKP